MTHSSYAAETYTPFDGMRAAIEVACVLALITHDVDTALVPINAFNDCQSLCNTISATGVVKPKKVNAAVAALREMYGGTAMSSITWVPTAEQTADCLTNQSSATSLRTTLLTARYDLRPRGTTTKTFQTERADLDAPTRTAAADSAKKVLLLSTSTPASPSGAGLRWAPLL